jgi:hypothetical protein
VIVQLTVPVGSAAFTTPVIVAVSVVVPPTVGFDEAEIVIVGDCLLIVKVNGELTADV